MSPAPYEDFDPEESSAPELNPRVQDIFTWKGKSYPATFVRKDDETPYRWWWVLSWETAELAEDKEFMLLRDAWQRGNCNAFTFSEYLRRITDG